MSVLDDNIIALKTVTNDYYGANYYGEEEALAAYKVVKSQSPFRYYGNNCLYETDRLEGKIKDYFGVKYVHSINSATGALACALHALDVTIGDEVIVPGYFWVSIPNTILMRGAFPVLCEVDESFNIDIDDLQRKITDKTKCVILVHMDGCAANVEEVCRICSEKKIKVLEDFSQCMGGSFKNKKVGTFGDISITSLQVHKLLTSGEGGLILTNDKKLYKKAVAKSDFGFLRDEECENDKECQYFTFGEGRRFNEISAAIMNVQISKIDMIIDHMRDVKHRIKKALADISPIRYRSMVDAEGEIATTLMLIFPSSEDVDTFLEISKKYFINNELKLYRLSDFGCHVYYNCTNLVEKYDVLPNGWPWNTTDKDYHYDKGTLKKSDVLFEKTIGIKLPGGLNDDQVNAIIFSLKLLISEYKEKIRG